VINRLDERQEIVTSLAASFDLFDAEEPMCSEARELFRNEIVPRAKQLVHGLVAKATSKGLVLWLGCSKPSAISSR